MLSGEVLEIVFKLSLARSEKYELNVVVYDYLFKDALYKVESLM